MTLMLNASRLIAAPPAPDPVPDHPWLRDTFRFVAGGYYPRSDTSLSLGPSGGGTAVIVDFEDTLDLEERSLTPIAEFTWRVSERWQLDMEYFALRRDANRTLATEVEWGDNVFPVGTKVDSTVNFADLRIGLGYSFFRTRDKEVAIGFGLHTSKIETSIKGSGSTNDSTDVLAPLPVAYLYSLFALTNEWALRMRVDWLSLTYGDYSGDVRSVSVDTIYQPFKNIGFGLGIRTLSVDVEVDHPDWKGDARLDFQGPTAFVSVSF